MTSRQRPQTRPPRALALAPLRGPGAEQLNQLADVIYDSWLDHSPACLYQPDQLATRLRDEKATILITEADQVSGPVLELPLILVAVTRGEPANVDLAAATRRGIPVLHTPGRNADAAAELAVALLFAVGRHIVVADREMRSGNVYDAGQLPQVRHRAWELAGKTCGIVGLGAVGRALRWRLEGLGITVIACDPYVDEATYELADLLANSDIVSMHAPATKQTAGMMGAAQFAAMRKGAIYLNAARAALHDLDALIDALRSERLAGAGLDHFEGELLDPAHPLTSLPSVVLTPHIGGATYNSEINHTTMIVEDIGRILSGQRPLHCANPEVFTQ
jgi:D-3-phosphoglycerate dehydrogenase